MSLINDLLSDLHAREALPAGREPLSGLRPVQHARARRAWLLPVGAALVASSAWAMFQSDGLRGVYPLTPAFAVAGPAHIASGDTEADAGILSVPTAVRTARSGPMLMLDTHMRSIERLGAAWPPVRAAAVTTNQTGAGAAALPAPAAHPASATLTLTVAPRMRGTPPRAVARAAASTAVAGPKAAEPVAEEPVAEEPVASSPAKVRAANPRAEGLAALVGGRLHEAQTHFQQVTTARPGDTQAWLYLARAFAEQGRAGDAERTLTAALTTADDAPSIARALARRLMTRNSVNEALKLLEAYRPKERLEPDHDAFIAALHQRLGRHDTAVKRYRGILAVRPEVAAWWVGLAISEEARGHGAAALDAYHHAHNLGNLDPRLADYAARRIAAMQGTGSS